MPRWMSVAAAACLAVGCSAAPSENVVDAVSAKGVPQASHQTFAGTWRSVTPSLEFIRLSVHSLSSQMGVLGARLTFSGVAWEGSGRIDADSLVASMAVVGAAQSSAVMIVRAPDDRSLRLQFRSNGAAPLELSFVRDE